jgi:hypothetical protein
MKSIERRFRNIQEANPYWSLLVCFNETVFRQNFTRRTIAFWFLKLVDKSEYLPSHQRTLIEQASTLSESI